MNPTHSQSQSLKGYVLESLSMTDLSQEDLVIGNPQRAGHREVHSCLLQLMVEKKVVRVKHGTSVYWRKA